jgi:hypothetical protein
LAVGIALRLLRAVRNVEEDEASRYSDMLDGFDLDSENVSRREYAAAEDEYLNCEYAAGMLESAIDDIKFAYDGRP